MTGNDRQEPVDEVQIGDLVIHKGGGAPWLVMDVAIDRKRHEMVIARRVLGKVEEFLRNPDDYVIAERAR